MRKISLSNVTGAEIFPCDNGVIISNGDSVLFPGGVLLTSRGQILQDNKVVYDCIKDGAIFHGGRFGMCDLNVSVTRKGKHALDYATLYTPTRDH